MYLTLVLVILGCLMLIYLVSASRKDYRLSRVMRYNVLSSRVRFHYFSAGAMLLGFTLMWWMTPASWIRVPWTWELVLLGRAYFVLGILALLLRFINFWKLSKRFQR